MTSVWVLQPKLKIELKDRDNSSSTGEAKALAKALKDALTIDKRIKNIVPSTKGKI